MFSDKPRNWRIVSEDGRLNVTLAACTREHAQSVLEQLERDIYLPVNLALRKA